MILQEKIGAHESPKIENLGISFLARGQCGEIAIDWFEFTVACGILYRSLISIKVGNLWSAFIANKYQWCEKSTQNTIFGSKVPFYIPRHNGPRYHIIQ